MGSAAEYSSITLIEAARKILATSTDRKRLAMKRIFTNSERDLSDLSVGGDDSDTPDAMQRGSRRNRHHQPMAQTAPITQMAGKRNGGVHNVYNIHVAPYRGCTTGANKIYRGSEIKQSTQGSKQGHTVLKIVIGPLYQMYQRYWLLGTDIQKGSWPTRFIQS